MQKMNSKANYGNWVPAAFMRMAWKIVGILFIFEVLDLIVLKNVWAAVILGVIFLAVLSLTLYMQKCRNLFDFNKGGLMGEIHEFLVKHLMWNGNGTLLDIGCGAGALTIRCAKKFPNAKLVGIDYWGKEWSYEKGQCENNAVVEGVADRIHFEKGDAAKLNYANNTFDAAVSNFVFHEVKTQPNKRLVVREALRVIKNGGAFAFQDLFGQEKLYGDMNAFIDELKKEGLSEIHYIPDIDKMNFIPSYVRAPWMLYGVGLIYGIK